MSSAVPLRDLPSAKSGASRKQGLEPKIKQPVTRTPGAIEYTYPVTLVKKGQSVATLPRTRLRNSLIGTVGLLELANAGDFAANVWNDVPVPIYALVFMALGGTFALALAIPAAFDVKRSWNNICFLREQRRRLIQETRQQFDGPSKAYGILAVQDILHREIGCELVTRFGMNIVMGSGAVIIGVGTLMAMGGANHTVWLVSNVLSGYLGNAAVAIYGVANAIWCTYLFRSARRHKLAAAEAFKGRPILRQLHRRYLHVRIFACTSGLTSILGGAGGMMTATLWMGYVVLIPVIISSFICSILWKRRLAYSRPFASPTTSLDISSLTKDLEYISSIKERLEAGADVDTLIDDAHSLVALLDFITRNDLFEDLILALAKDQIAFDTLFSSPLGTVEIEEKTLLGLPAELHPKIVDTSRACITNCALLRCTYRERYLCDVLGSLVSGNMEKREVYALDYNPS